MNIDVNTLGKVGAFFIGIANFILCALFFYSAIGELSNVLPTELAQTATIAISFCISAGFLLAETLAHKEDSNAVTYSIIAIMVIINVFAGFNRVDQNDKDLQVAAIVTAQTDPRYAQIVDAIKDYQTNVLNDGSVKNDSLATSELRALRSDLGELIGEYKQDSSQSPAFFFVITLSFIAVTLAYSYLLSYVQFVGHKAQSTPLLVTEAEQVEPFPRMNPRATREQRLLYMIEIITQTKSVDISQLAYCLSVSPNTIYSYLKTETINEAIKDLKLTRANPQLTSNYNSSN